MRRFALTLALGAALAAPAGARAALFNDDEAREQISQLKQRF